MLLHDNVAAHTVIIVQQFLMKRGGSVLRHPLYSPDCTITSTLFSTQDLWISCSRRSDYFMYCDVRSVITQFSLIRYSSCRRVYRQSSSRREQMPMIASLVFGCTWSPNLREILYFFTSIQKNHEPTFVRVKRSLFPHHKHSIIVSEFQLRSYFSLLKIL